MKSKNAIVVTVMLVVCFSSGYLLAKQQNMRQALAYLNSAKSELQSAKHDKGGHRLKAISLINQAIAQVNKGIEAGN